MKLYLKILPIMVGAGLIAACSSISPPTQQLTETRMIIEQAENVGAKEFAPLEIRDATLKLKQARELADKKEYKKAKLLLEHARVDAELAQAKALSGKSQEAAAELRESIRLLKEELQRKIK